MKTVAIQHKATLTQMVYQIISIIAQISQLGMTAMMTVAQLP
jgi:hypothetical protein